MSCGCCRPRSEGLRSTGFGTVFPILGGWIVATLVASLCGCAQAPARSRVRNAEKLRDAAASTLGTGSQCSAARPPTEPDLFGWDPGSRGRVATLAREGLVVVRYEKKGCDVMLSVLGNCTSQKAAYRFSSYTEKQSRMAEDEAGLYANFPLAAAGLRARIGASSAVRADYMLAGIESVPAGTSISSSDLKGDCSGATHVVRAIHRGVFAMGAAKAATLKAEVSLLGVDHAESVSILDQAGTPSSCSKDARQVNEGCDVPLRLELMALSAVAADSSGPASSQEAIRKAAALVETSEAAQTDDVAGIAQRAAARKEAWKSISALLKDPNIAEEAKLELVERFLDNEQGKSALRDEAEGQRDRLVYGKEVYGTTWVSAAGTYPWGARIGAVRLRWLNFQLQAFHGFFSMPGDGNFHTGGGLAGIGGKWMLDSAGRFELGFLAWPASFGFLNREVAPSGAKCSQHSDEYESTYCESMSFSFLHVQPYLAVNYGGFQFEAGAYLPLLWIAPEWAATGLDSTGAVTGKTDSKIYGGGMPMHFYLGFGY